MPLGKDNISTKDSAPKGLLTKILEVFDSKVVGEIDGKTIDKRAKRHNLSLQKERREIAQRLKAVQAEWHEMEDDQEKKD